MDTKMFSKNIAFIVFKLSKKSTSNIDKALRIIGVKKLTFQSWLNDLDLPDMEYLQKIVVSTRRELKLEITTEDLLHRDLEQLV